MFSKLKRFLSVSLCLIFYIFLFAGNFGGNSVCSAAESSTIKKYVPIDISNKFNSNAIWGNGDDWEEQFKSQDSIDAGEENKLRELGVDGTRAFYTKCNHNENNVPDDGGMPDDGRLTIGGVPFNFNASSGKDCIKFCPKLDFLSKSVDLGNVKVKNLYVMGTAGAILTGSSVNADIKFYDNSDNEIAKYRQTLDVYDWYNEQIISQKGTKESSIYDYKHYVVRRLDGTYLHGDNTYVQCWRLNKFSESGFGEFDDTEITRINITFDDKVNGACLTIFAITAEVEYDNNITLSDVKHDSFKIECGTEGSKQVNISTTKGLNSESMTTAVFPYTPEAYEGTTYHCTIYDDDKKAYYYFDVTTKKSLKLVVQTPSGLVYNGAAQQLVTGCLTLDAHGAARPADENDLLKSNIYLRIENATGTPAHKTGWYNLNSLANLTATNAGTYNIYYELDKGALSDYDLISTTVVSGTSESNNSIIIDENGD